MTKPPNDPDDHPTITTDPLNIMIGATIHYNVGGLDVNRFCMANRWDCCARDVLRYLSRHRVKDGRADMSKALHYVGIRDALLKEYPYADRSLRNVRMSEFIVNNAERLGPLERAALSTLEDWVYGGFEAMRLHLIEDIEKILKTYEKARILSSCVEPDPKYCSRHGPNETCRYCDIEKDVT